MFLDASVIVAILARESGSDEYENRLAASEGPFFLSPLVKFEASVALARLRSPGGRTSVETIRRAARAVEAFVEDIAAEEIAISPEIGRGALEAAAIYGKAVGHAASLNFGDCYSYACAKSLKVPLLYKGDDFSLTDLA
ncbi:type II toxin-antitoxin system VapC family toxin [Enterovirga rhinocerotis]|uniref:Ribonuclease VapC n=1 Tax=Enterovirga rhinocerotis TaxID=1339210 RepID=A0A4R7BW18_9HYPH|nr:type II toxin-antitoxin system VapC family toxin [Enterovirga rhinocerotis]TDR89751.1 ribonuclease VapC [Enterovirga rhinocerotis]